MQLLLEAGLLFGIIMFMTTLDWSDILSGPSKTFMRGLAFAGVVAIIILSIRVLLMLILLLIGIIAIAPLLMLITVPLFLFGLYCLIISLINIIRDMQCKPPIKMWRNQKKHKKHKDEDYDEDDDEEDI